MTREQIIDRLRSIMARNATTDHDWAQVGATDTIASLGIDSLAMLDFLYDIQQEFRVEFEPKELIEVRTIGQLAIFIAERSSA